MLTCISEGKDSLAKFCPVITPKYKGLMYTSRKEAFSDSVFSSSCCLEKYNTNCKCYNTFLLSLTQTVACIFFATCKAIFCTILVQHDMHLTSIAIETASFQKGWWCILCKECQVDWSWILKRVAFSLDCDWMESAKDVYCIRHVSSQRPFVVYIMAVIQVSSFLPHLPIQV